MKRSKLHKALIVIVFFIFGSCVQDLRAQQLFPNSEKDTTQNEETTVKTDPLGRSNPRGTVTGIFNALSNDDFLLASMYFDLSELSENESDSLTVSLVQNIETILNKNGTILPLGLINDTQHGDPGDGLKSTIENIGSINLDGNTIPIYLEQVVEDTDLNIWLFSKETISQITPYIEQNSELFERNASSVGFLSSKWKGAPIIDWLSILLYAFISYLLSWLITAGIKSIVGSLWKNIKTNKYSKFLTSLLIPLRLVLTVTFLLAISRLMGVAIVVRQSFSVVNLVVMWTALFIFIWLLIDAFSTLADERLRERQIFSGLSAISFLKNSAKFTLILIAILIIFETLGFNVTAGIAALGVGGIALALGAQKTVENIVGGLSVVFDQPVSVGDFCKFGDTLGTVEKIGMRSTRIRTTARTVVTIPNADFSSQLIENFAKRDMFLFQTTIGLRYETSTSQMRYVLVELRNVLYAHPKVDRNPARVRFIGYGSDALNVELYAYILASDWNEFLAVQEDINLRIAEVVESSGSGFAFPSQTVYLSKDQGLSESKKKAAEKKVQEWIDNNELQMPEFDENAIVKIENTIQYPLRKHADNSGEV